jgi:hypothetical protein
MNMKERISLSKNWLSMKLSEKDKGLAVLALIKD